MNSGQSWDGSRRRLIEKSFVKCVGESNECLKPSEFWGTQDGMLLKELHKLGLFETPCPVVERGPASEKMPDISCDGKTADRLANATEVVVCCLNLCL